MGNCFGKPSKPSATSAATNNFSSPGRTLGGNPATQSTSVPIPAQEGFTGANSLGRRLGSKGEVPALAQQTTTTTAAAPLSSTASSASEDPKAAAARAAEERLKASQTNKGKLGKQLEAQRARTQTDTLVQASREIRGQREADRAHEVRAYN